MNPDGSTDYNNLADVYYNDLKAGADKADAFLRDNPEIGGLLNDAIAKVFIRHAFLDDDNGGGYWTQSVVSLPSGVEGKNVRIEVMLSDVSAEEG